MKSDDIQQEIRDKINEIWCKFDLEDCVKIDELKILKDKYLAAVEEEKLSIIEEGDLVFVKAKSGAYSAIIRVKETWTNSIMGGGFYIEHALSPAMGEYANMSFSFNVNEFKKITF
jgi:hypothetical protein